MIESFQYSLLLVSLRFFSKNINCSFFIIITINVIMMVVIIYHKFVIRCNNVIDSERGTWQSSLEATGVKIVIVFPIEAAWCWFFQFASASYRLFLRMLLYRRTFRNVFWRISCYFFWFFLLCAGHVILTLFWPFFPSYSQSHCQTYYSYILRLFSTISYISLTVKSFVLVYRADHRWASCTYISPDPESKARKLFVAP